MVLKGQIGDGCGLKDIITQVWLLYRLLLWTARAEKWHPQMSPCAGSRVKVAMGHEEMAVGQQEVAVGCEEVAVGQQEGFRLLCSTSEAVCNDPTSCSSELAMQRRNGDSNMSIPSKCASLMKGEDLLLSKPSLKNCRRWNLIFPPTLPINSMQERHFVNIFFSVLSYKLFFQRSTWGNTSEEDAIWSPWACISHKGYFKFSPQNVLCVLLAHRWSSPWWKGKPTQLFLAGCPGGMWGAKEGPVGRTWFQTWPGLKFVFQKTSYTAIRGC